MGCFSESFSFNSWRLLKSLEPYSFPKGTSKEEVCSRLIKPTTQAYLGNVGLLTRPLTCGIFWPNTCSISGGKAQHCPRACGSDTMIKSIEHYSSTKGTLREEVCSRLIKPTTQIYLGQCGTLNTPPNRDKEILRGSVDDLRPQDKALRLHYTLIAWFNTNNALLFIETIIGISLLS
jgi:hypothetical protein